MNDSDAPAKPKRDGTAFWLSDQDGTMLRDLAQAEDRSKQAVLRRALTLYAAQSAEYQATKLG
jgi:hypothetical protein